MYFQGHDVTPARLARAEAGIDRARELDPAHPEVREAYGDFLYYGRRDYDAALAEYRAALQRLPNSASLIARIAWIQRRKGLWEESLAGLERVRAMDPRSGSNLMNHGVSLYATRRYGEAAETIDRAVAFNPGMDLLWSLRVQNEYARGDTAAAVAMLREVPEAVLREPFTAGARLEGLRLRRDYRGLRDRVLATDNEVVGAAGTMRILALYLGWAYQGLGEPDRAREAFREALSVAERLADEQPGDSRLPGAVGLALALAELGRGEDAVASGRRGVGILGPADDALWGYNTVWALARIHGRLGEAAAAVELIEQAMSTPNQAGHVGLLELDPLFDPIRDHPGFQALLKSYADDGER
jgi:tetratricopeptide (TPR) repeat protein